MTLAEAADRYLATLITKDSDTAPQEIHNFVRWFGPGRSLQEISAPDIGAFAEHIAASSVEPQKKLEPIRAFLSFAHKQKWSKTNLSVHLHAKKATAKGSSYAKRDTVTPVRLTAEGFEELNQELKRLIAERPRIAEELAKARADRDFRENAPLDAAREHQARVEARIRELEAILKRATIIDTPQQSASKISIGDTVVIQEVSSNEEMTYTLVSSREANPAKGKISTASPTGKCLIGRSEGETIEVIAPAGKVCYRIKKVLHNKAIT
ncbi:MAG: transcription elongation factor GreA [Dehalococcoidia bacterium]|nr:transcription elongation factor GreA [Dehalococcoidia bacterium]